MAIVNYVRNGRRFGDRKMLTGAKIPKMSLQAYDNCRLSQTNDKVKVWWSWLLSRTDPQIAAAAGIGPV